MNTNTQHLIQVITTSLVTVAGSYLTITSHIDAAVADKVHEAIAPVEWRVTQARTHTDSLHRVQALEIDVLRRSQNQKRNR